MLGTPVEAGGGIGMERLTEKISNGTRPKTLRGLIRWFVTHNGIRKDVIIGEYNKLYDRLVEYEDLGITPEQVRQMDAEFTRASKELADYKKSVDQGRLLHLPCKAGDTVYLEAEYENEITEGRVTEISVLPDGVCIYVEREIGSGCSEGYGVNDFGYDVFMKREDAEKAIKEEQP